MAETRPQITQVGGASKHPEASASPYSHAYSVCAQSAHAAILSLAHIASKSITRFGIGASLRAGRNNSYSAPPVLSCSRRALLDCKHAVFPKRAGSCARSASTRVRECRLLSVRASPPFLDTIPPVTRLACRSCAEMEVCQTCWLRNLGQRQPLATGRRCQHQFANRRQLRFIAFAFLLAMSVCIFVLPDLRCPDQSFRAASEFGHSPRAGIGDTAPQKSCSSLSRHLAILGKQIR